MANLYKSFFFLFIAGSLTASAGAQVRFNVYSNPYSGPGVTVSVGNGGYCQQPVYNPGYAVYPVRGNRGGRAVVVTPVYNQGYYNQGYYNNGNCNNNGYYVNNGYYNNNAGYYNQGYVNPGYNPGYGNYNGNQGYYSNNGNRRCR